MEHRYFSTKTIAFQDCKKMRGTIRVDVEVEWRVAWEQTVIERPILMKARNNGEERSNLSVS